MKKYFILWLFLALVIQAADAQRTLKGRVIDKDGNPIAGAKVENANGNEQVTTDMNGRFTLETRLDVKKVNVYYTGMQTTKKKAKQHMLIKMGQTNWWNEKPNKYKWLIGVETAIPDMDEVKPAFGLTIGRVKNFGWYLKGVYSSSQSTVGETSGSTGDPWMTGEMKPSYWSAVVGGIVRLNSPFHLYVGVGYVDRKVAWESLEGDYYEYDDDTYNGAAIDVGLMFKVKMIFLNFGIQTCLNSFDSAVGNFGIGVCF